jgi:hypothetical protein
MKFKAQPPSESGRWHPKLSTLGRVKERRMQVRRVVRLDRILFLVPTRV